MLAKIKERIFKEKCSLQIQRLTPSQERQKKIKFFKEIYFFEISENTKNLCTGLEVEEEVFWGFGLVNIILVANLI